MQRNSPLEIITMWQKHLKNDPFLIRCRSFGDQVIGVDQLIRNRLFFPFVPLLCRPDISQTKVMNFHDLASSFQCHGQKNRNSFEELKKKGHSHKHYLRAAPKSLRGDIIQLVSGMYKFRFLHPPQAKNGPCFYLMGITKKNTCS